MLSSRVCRAFLFPEMHAIAKIRHVKTVQTNIPKITIIANITNQGSDAGKYNESLKESTDREQGKGLHKCNKNTENNNCSKNNQNNEPREQHWQI